MKPFRWNLQKREQLGSLLDGERSESFEGFFDELVECALKVVATAEGHSLVFVGRSPESIYDLLTGAFEGTNHADQLVHLNFSNRFKKINEIKGEAVFNYEALKSHFCELGLSPQEIIQHEHGICFVDLVYGGGTYQLLFEFLQGWCKEQRDDFNALKRKLRFIGITSRTKNSPNTWRWQQHAEWVQLNQEIVVKNVSIPSALWSYLGDYQPKVEESNPPSKWSDESILLPPRHQRNLKALRLAYDIYLLGKEKAELFLKL